MRSSDVNTGFNAFPSFLLGLKQVFSSIAEHYKAAALKVNASALKHCSDDNDP